MCLILCIIFIFILFFLFDGVHIAQMIIDQQIGPIKRKLQVFIRLSFFRNNGTEPGWTTELDNKAQDERCKPEDLQYTSGLLEGRIYFCGYLGIN